MTDGTFDILLPGGVAMITVARLRASQMWPYRVRFELQLRRPWDVDPPLFPDANITLHVGKRGFLIHAHQNLF